MIHGENVCKIYDDNFVALSPASFDISAGDFIFLTGHSGAGKSTFLRLIAGLEPLTSGTLIVNDHALSSERARQQLRSEIGFVFQDNYLIPDKTVAENLALPLIIKGLTEEAIQKRIRAILDKVHLSEKENAMPATLSTGQLQRVGLARAAINSPTLLLADEPTGNLDPELAKDMISLFRFFNEAGTTVIIATHDLHLINPTEKQLHLDKGVLSCL
jgi:cell division transport system ATP-binding protein